MKDEVKITVIATGFQNGQPMRNPVRANSAATAIQHERTVSAFIPSTPAAPVRQQPVVRQQVPPQTLSMMTTAASTTLRDPSPSALPREASTLEAVKQSISLNSDVEHDDLDVPAFIRKQRELS
jgi:hypothetical protein